MKIDEAIENLKDEKNRGAKNIIVAWWGASGFGRQDDETWEHATKMVERNHDWSATHEDLQSTLTLYTSE